MTPDEKGCLTVVAVVGVITVLILAGLLLYAQFG